MTSTMRFDKWENTLGQSVLSPDGSDYILSKKIKGNTQNDFAAFGSTVKITLGNSTPVKVAYDRALHASTSMSWSYGSVNSGIPIYNWKHSQTGYYNLTYWVRTTADVWNVLSVCKNDSLTQPVGTSSRTGSQVGSWGFAGELIYKVENISDTFALFHWGTGSAGTLADFSGTPPAGFIATPQHGGAAPANGYFVTFNVTPVSSI
jgi:hypothetical protein